MSANFVCKYVRSDLVNGWNFLSTIFKELDEMDKLQDVYLSV